MAKIQEKLYKKMPGFLKDCLVTMYDYLQYRKRHGEGINTGMMKPSGRKSFH